jgi:hypothetical protein
LALKLAEVVPQLGYWIIDRRESRLPCILIAMHIEARHLLGSRNVLKHVDPPATRGLKLVPEPTVKQSTLIKLWRAPPV